MPTTIAVRPEQRDPTYVTWSQRMLTLHPGSRQAYNEAIYFTRLSKPLSQCRVALASSAGVVRQDQEPFDAENEMGDPSYRAIPADSPTDQLFVSHTHYNHADADRDVNCVFPISRLPELADEGTIGDVAPIHFSFMGYCPDPTALIERTGPEIARRLKADGVDAVFLTPG